MSKKRFIKLLMGRCGYSRNEANVRAMVDLLVWGDYKTAWIIKYSSLAKGFRCAFTQTLNSFGVPLTYGSYFC